MCLLLGWHEARVQRMALGGVPCCVVVPAAWQGT